MGPGPFPGKYMGRKMPAVILVVIAIALVVIYPIALIWALNTLFGLSIPITFWTWVATTLLSAPFSARVNKS